MSINREELNRFVAGLGNAFTEIEQDFAADLAARVPDTPASPTTKFLRGDGTWATVEGGGGGLSQAQVLARSFCKC